MDYGGTYSEEVFSGIYTYTYSTHIHKLVHHDFYYPTCTEEGKKEYYECTDCGKWYRDKTAEHQILSADEVVLEPYGHNWGEWQVAQKPTKTEKGIEMRVCAEDPDHVEYRDIPALGTSDSSKTSPTKARQSPPLM